MGPKLKPIVKLSRFWSEQKHRVSQHERVVFLQRWLRHPLRMGAVMPSSKALADLMCRSLPTGALPQGVVVELGPGTGRFTQALLEFGLSPSNLWLVEMDPHLCEFLRKRFPEVNVVHGDAATLGTLLPPSVHQTVTAVVSGLPLINIPGEKIQQIIQSSLSILAPQGCFLQFTYGLFSPIPAQKLDLQQQRLGKILLNLPPASVWRYQRRSV